jgi:magnesium chelatase family protein
VYWIITGPESRIVINMAPADMRNEGSAYDLPHAVGILASHEKVAKNDIESFVEHKLVYL